MTLIDDVRFKALLGQRAALFKDTRFNDCVERFLKELVRDPAMKLIAREHGSKVYVTVGLRNSVPKDYAAPELPASRNLFGTYSDKYHAPIVFKADTPYGIRERTVADIPRGAGPPPPVNPRDEPGGQTLEQYMVRREACLKDLTRSEEHCWLTVVERDNTAAYVDVLGHRFTGLPWSYDRCFGGPLEGDLPKPYAVDDIYVKYP
jgi:hypothetical protein